MPQQRERRPVGPVDVLQHEQHRTRRGQLHEQPGDRLEQPPALGVVFRTAPLDGQRQRREEAGQLTPAVRHHAVGAPVVERLHDRTQSLDP